ncbi:hypothetical protein C7212DRAFT_325473 [Tuber magnatum]|uniref:Uncharacterized protein n=1 Tax=Tuber magnatum TaxID=42249 RepID=A0A317SPC5_9PEZI|nr:hypothetical protein C7212DRAFT_325473 [Tuber magnatum]
MPLLLSYFSPLSRGLGPFFFLNSIVIMIPKQSLFFIIFIIALRGQDGAGTLLFSPSLIAESIV